MVDQQAIKSDSVIMEMIQRIQLSIEESDRLRKQDLDIIYRAGTSTRPITETAQLIRRLEDNIFDLENLLIKQEEIDIWIPSIQSMIDDTFDILDYVKKLP